MKDELDAIVIGILLAHPSQVPLVGLAAGEFNDPSMGLVWGTMLAMASEGLVPDAFSLHDRIPAVDLPLLVDLMRNSRSLENLPYYVSELRKRARAVTSMRLIDTAKQHLQDGKDADKVRIKLAKKLTEVDQEQSIDQYDMNSTLGRVVDYLDMAYTARAENRLIGVPSGIAYLDLDTGGFHKSNLIVVGARPAQGKTAFALTCALNAAMRGYRVGIVSTEMSITEVGMRFVALVSGVANTAMRDGSLQEADFKRIMAATVTLKNLPIRIFDRPACPVSRVFVQAKGWQLQGGLDLLIVDYLGRLLPDERVENRAREIGKAAAAMKNVARQLNIPVMLLSQLNRSSMVRADKRPTMAELRDSGEIEQEADLVALLHRAHAYDANADPREAEIILDKNRHGPCEIIRCQFEAETMRWLNSAPRMTEYGA